MAIPALPVWTIRPNWREPIIERLSWLTDIADSTDGTEQRMALRLSPRRQFEMLFNPIDNVRSYFDLFLHRLGSEEFFMPLFHDRAQLTAAAGAGATGIFLDTTYREHLPGGYSLLLGEDPFDFEIVESQIVSPDKIDLIGVTTKAWPKGTSVFPVRVSRLALESSMAAITSRVGSATLAFEVNQADDFPEGVWSGLEYLGKPVMETGPNFREAVDLSFLRKSEVLDNETGLTHLNDSAGRAFTVQMHSWLLSGRQAQTEFRSMLYRLRGKQKAIWLPTFRNDLILSAPAAAADEHIDVKKIGYAYTGGDISGRKHFIFRSEGVTGEIDGTAAAPSTAEERLTLAAAIGEDIEAGRYASFMEVGRLDQDTVEITHHTDSDGAAECRTAFRSFLDERIEDEITEPPMPSSLMNDDDCGVIWHMKIRIEWDHGVETPSELPTTLSITKNPSYFGAYDSIGAGVVVHQGEVETTEITVGLETWASDPFGSGMYYKFAITFPEAAFSEDGPRGIARVYFKKFGMTSWVRGVCIAGDTDVPRNNITLERTTARDYHFAPFW
jgi:hypothetical protein